MTNRAAWKRTETGYVLKANDSVTILRTIEAGWSFGRFAGHPVYSSKRVTFEPRLGTWGFDFVTTFADAALLAVSAAEECIAALEKGLRCLHGDA
jgi:hypothetical protein